MRTYQLTKGSWNGFMLLYNPIQGFLFQLSVIYLIVLFYIEGRLAWGKIYLNALQWQMTSILVRGLERSDKMISEKNNMNESIEVGKRRVFLCLMEIPTKDHSLHKKPDGPENFHFKERIIAFHPSHCLCDESLKSESFVEEICSTALF